MKLSFLFGLIIILYLIDSIYSLVCSGGCTTCTSTTQCTTCTKSASYVWNEALSWKGSGKCTNKCECNAMRYCNSTTLGSCLNCNTTSVYSVASNACVACNYKCTSLMYRPLLQFGMKDFHP